MHTSHTTQTMQQPPGAAARPVPVVEASALPDPETFTTQYVNRHRPVVLKGAAPVLVPKAWALFHNDAEGGDEGRWLAPLTDILKGAGA
jgi:hypothetical protein